MKKLDTLYECDLLLDTDDELVFQEAMNFLKRVTRPRAADLERELAQLRRAGTFERIRQFFDVFSPHETHQGKD